VLAITRYRVPAAETDDFVRTAQGVLHAIESSPGHRSGRLARAVDEPELWAMVTDWDGAGFYRRALGAYEVRVALIPLSRLAIDEAGAYEIVETPEAAGSGQDPSGPGRRASG
jgi:hypothetical protein